jgi:hypothetical protein
MAGWHGTGVPPAHPATDVVNWEHRPVSERPQPARPGGEFFVHPASPAHRRYEALRAYLAEGLPADQAADRFGYTPASLLSAVRDFRAGARDFFVSLTRSSPRQGADIGADQVKQPRVMTT